MITFEINHEPVSWSAHQGYGRKSYNPKHKERQFFRWQIQSQYNRETPILGPVRMVCAFHMPIPKSISKTRRSQMLNGLIYHISRPDCSNLLKFTEDTLKEIVIKDDSQVVFIEAKKIYSERPRTIIIIEELSTVPFHQLSPSP